ncbi:hypothetical protein RD110_02100 [Rhodoferax koreense]|uniref:Uncharacterized protein n=2 Tax=Rhodoferax koreensis TaxID=1842727 RepID=A0A1P8JQX8_9BURK|nr:hypothetical protein RD110_02100 [Rhodoferax koreense]
MGFLVGLTGAFGLLASFVLLHAGIDSMALRYPLALGLAYLFFLFLLWLWLRTTASDYIDLPDVGELIPSGGGDVRPPVPMSSGGGGNFGGAGASRSFDTTSGVSLDEPTSSTPLGDAASAVADTDEFTVPLMVILLALGLALASFYVVYLAPSLFAEILFDGALSYSLYRHLRGAGGSHWMRTAVRRTVLPFGVTAVFVCLVGVAMAAYAPGARTIGDVMHQPRDGQ